MKGMEQGGWLHSVISSSKFPRSEHWILLGIFVLAILLRIHVDPNIPFHYDPGKNIVYARAALDWFPLIPQTNPYFNLGEYYEYQVLFPYLTALLHIITGASLVQATTWLTVFSGAALTITVYYFTLELFDSVTAALISAFLVAVSKIQLLQYVNYYPQILAMTLVPLSFLFLIRYIRSREWKYMISVVVLSSLIVLGSYLVALVYFIILLLSLAIWSILDRKTLSALILIPVSTILLLTFFWLPMVWRNGVLQTVDTVIATIFSAQGTFTNQPWTLTTFLTLSSGAIIAIGAVIGAIIILKKIRWDFSKVLLSVWLVVSFLLMASYLFTPILWVDRYFPFLDMAVMILAGGALAIIITAINARKFGPKYKGYLVLLVLIIPLVGGIYPGITFGPWGYPSDFAMLKYMDQNLPKDSLVVAPPGIQGFWVSALSGDRILGGESSQILGKHHRGDRDSDLIINSEDIEQKMEYIRKFGVEYIFIPIHEDFSFLWNPRLDREGVLEFQNETYFETVKSYSDSFGLTILVKVRNPVQPQYHILTVNWVVTAIGYLISLASLIGLIFLPRFIPPRKTH